MIRPHAFPQRRRVRPFAAALAGLAGLWLAGLLWFASSMPEEVSDAQSETDAIVVLTGGSLRIQSGLDLLAAGKAKKLFISGVNPGVDIAALLRVAHPASDHIACCVVLGHAADNTLGNALETAEWMRQEGFHSLRLVTSSYHMRRSLLEFSRAMPEVQIIAHPVFPEGMRQESWRNWRRTMNLILSEYDKYLLALARPTLLRAVTTGSAPN